MFETAETGHAISRQEYKVGELELRAGLIEAQQALRTAGFPVIVIVSGVESAGKSEVVNRLNEWLDTRGVRTVAFWDETDEERERPYHWRFWRQLPPRGVVGILFGSWYTRPIVRRAFKEAPAEVFADELARIAELERTLTDDGALIVKLWFHLSKKAQKQRLKQIARDGERKLTPYEKSFTPYYDRFAEVSAAAIRATDSVAAPWHIIEATDFRYRDLKAGRTLLKALQQRLADNAAPLPPAKPAASAKVAKAVAAMDMSVRLGRIAYDRRLRQQQARLNALAWDAYNDKLSTVVVFEGADAAGKGGAIRRMGAAIDARLLSVVPIAAPTDEERAHHYLWRFWRHLPRAGYFTIYDRSWYGRVLVERVEGFARPDEWARAYGEIKAFEQQLIGHGICVVKYWLQLSSREQLRRFQERERIAHKQHKITEEDWRNRAKAADYRKAVDEMVARTSTSKTPWTLVAADDKLHARIQIIETLCDRLEAALGRN